MSGAPGAGKSMLAQRLPSILPPLTPRELLEVSMIHSVAGILAGGALTDRRPFRAPHHSASMPALVGGGVHAKPGEISLAHNGVLFLDELPEFQPQVLDSLRQPLETGEVAISRANHRVVYPARFQLIAAMNPCRCGSANEPGYACKRAPNERCVAQYLGRLSGPLIDRFDLLVDVPSVSAADLMTPPPREGSAEVAARVVAARNIQLARYAELGHQAVASNAAAPSSLVETIADADDSGLRLLRDAAERLRLSARGYHRVLKLARTLADLDGGGPVRRVHLAEALSYRGACPLRRCGTQQVRHTAHEAGRRGADRGGDLQALALRAGGEKLDHPLDQPGQIHRLDGEVEPSGLDPGEIENLVDQRDQRRAGAVNRLDVAGVLGAQARPAQQVRHTENAVQRGANLMAHGGEEARLGLARGFRPV